MGTSAGSSGMRAEYPQPGWQERIQQKRRQQMQRKLQRLRSEAQRKLKIGMFKSQEDYYRIEQYAHQKYQENAINAFLAPVNFLVRTASIIPRTISYLSTSDNYKQYDVCSSQNINAIYIRVRASWLGQSQQLAGIGSFFTGITTGMALTHWWVQIQTEDPFVWYWAQLNNDSVKLRKCFSQSEVQRKGTQSGGNYKTKNNSTKMSKRINRKISEIRTWCLQSNNRYDLVNNNCQTWAEDFFNWA